MGRRKRGRKPLARAATDADGLHEPGRFSARRKTETILRMLRGEPLDSRARELGGDGGDSRQRREQFLAGSQAVLKSRPADERDEEIQRLRAKVGQIDEVLLERCHRLEATPAFTPAEAERMSQTRSPSTNRRYGLARVCRVWALPRSAVYLSQARRSAPPTPAAERGPKPRWSDATLLERIRAVLAAASFLGRGIARWGSGCRGRRSGPPRRASCA